MVCPVLEDLDREQADAAGDAMAVAFELGERRAQHGAAAVHLEALQDFHEVPLGEAEALDRAG